MHTSRTSHICQLDERKRIVFIVCIRHGRDDVDKEVQGPFYYREAIIRRNGIQYGTRLIKVQPKQPKKAAA